MSNNPFYGYQPYQNISPYQGRLNQMQSDFTVRQEITRVNGKNGAEAYMLPPNSSILLLDETAPIVWLAHTDGAGYKTVTPYTITPYQAESTPDFNSLEERIKRLEEKLNEQSNYSTLESTNATQL